jgi:DNA-binding MarR family transcriptional regulator
MVMNEKYSHHHDWRQVHLGRLLGEAMRRFDEKVLFLMSNDSEVPLALANLAARDQITAAHIHITRHLAMEGSRLTELAQSAGVTKQGMSELVNQCVNWGLVQKCEDPSDARAKIIKFTDAGISWLKAFERAVRVAELEFHEEVGKDVATVTELALEVYTQEQIKQRPRL